MTPADKADAQAARFETRAAYWRTEAARLRAAPPRIPRAERVSTKGPFVVVLAVVAKDKSLYVYDRLTRTVVSLPKAEVWSALQSASNRYTFTYMAAALRASASCRGEVKVVQFDDDGPIEPRSPEAVTHTRQRLYQVPKERGCRS